MMKRQRLIYTILAVILPFSAVLAQEQLTLRERAAASFERYEYARSAEFYSRLADRNNPRLQDLEYAAESYYRMRDFAAAETWFARAIRHKEHELRHILRYADVLKTNGKYEEAKDQYRLYADRSGDARSVEVKMAGCDSALLWMARPSLHSLRNEQEVNTAASEFSVSVIGDDAYFAGESGAVGQSSFGLYGWTGRPFVKLHRASVGQNISLTASALLEADLNDLDYHVGPVASPDNGETLYITRTYVGQEVGLEVERGTKYRTHRLELYEYSKQDGAWVAIPFVHNDPDHYSVGHATFSVDGQVMYFASDRPGGYGGTDIWFSERQANGSWGNPVNAGPQINTAGNELFPMIGVNETLYYSTDGLAGMGGLDIFQTAGSRAQWDAPVNMGFPLNSSHDDFSLTTVQDDDAAQFGYLSSNRPGGKGADDIYSFRFVKPQPELVVVPEPEPEPVVETEVPELVKGKTFVLENLYYDFDKHDIRPDAALVLDELVKTMNENPTLKIELSSHTDSRGNAAYNMALSDRRARAAVEYIISRGISRDRLVAKGYGETRLVNECANGVSCTEEQHQANRRTEVTVLDI